MNITAHKTQILALKPGDKNFRIVDGLVVADRAGFELSKQCPYNYGQVIVECIDRGWLKPVAHITERELLFMGLANET